VDKQPVGRAADVWSFGVLLYECMTGTLCARGTRTQQLAAKLRQQNISNNANNNNHLPELVQLFEECRQLEPRNRPLMADVHRRLQRLVIQDAIDSQRLKEELKRAEAQDRETYDSTWASHYAPYSRALLDYAYQLQQQHQQALRLGFLRLCMHLCSILVLLLFLASLFTTHVFPPNFLLPNLVRQPLKQHQGKGSMEELEGLARVSSRMHAILKALVEGCGGTYLCAPRKSYERCVQKVKDEYGGDYGKLLDLERATGLFDQPGDMLECLQRVMLARLDDPISSSVPLCVLRCKDRLNNPLASGYRDLLLNLCDAKSGFVMELQLNFHKITQIKSQTHRFYELTRVMKLHQ